jgi:hypothetical protein
MKAITRSPSTAVSTYVPPKYAYSINGVEESALPMVPAVQWRPTFPPFPAKINEKTRERRISAKARRAEKIKTLRQIDIFFVKAKPTIAKLIPPHTAKMKSIKLIPANCNFPGESQSSG